MRWIPVFVLLITIGANAQVDDVQQQIKKGAQIAGDALVKADYQAFAGLMYPRLLELIGGSKRMIVMLKSGREQMRASGEDIVKMTVKNVYGPVNAGSEKHAVVTYTLQMSVPRGNLYQEAYLLAILRDQSADWPYVDGANLTKDKVHMLFPQFNDDLVLPDKTEPRFVPK
jgi:hypothetical protein